MARHKDLRSMAASEFRKQYGHLESHWSPEQWKTLCDMFIAGALWRNIRVKELRKAMDGNAPWHHTVQAKEPE
jgi:hypothetical protein